jgi:hypothetical protein
MRHIEVIGSRQLSSKLLNGGRSPSASNENKRSAQPEPELLQTFLSFSYRLFGFFELSMLLVVDEFAGHET